MHELAIAEGIIDQVTGKLPETRVTCVCLEIGALSGVVADSLQFCFGLATEGTNLEGALLEITEPPARCHCRACGREFSQDRSSGACLPIALCPCGSTDVAVLSGEELMITSVKVA